MDAPNPETNFAVAPTFSPQAILQDGTKVDALIATIEAAIAEQKPDTSTKKGREGIASFAYKIARTKTAIDDAGAEAVKSINATRNRTKAKLDELRDKARQPLTDWEAADDRRITECNDVIEMLRTAARVTLTTTSAQAAETLTKIEAVTIDPDAFQDLTQIAGEAKANAITSLTDAVETIKAREAQTEELARLKRAEAAAPKAAPKPVAAKSPGPLAPEPKPEPESTSQPERASAEPKVSEPATVWRGGTIPNRGEVIRASAKAIEALGVGSDVAIKIVVAIAARQIPNISITF